MNPLECLERERDKIKTEYVRVLCVTLGVSATNHPGHNIFNRQKEIDLLKINKIKEQYDITINVLKALNNYDELLEIN